MTRLVWLLPIWNFGCSSVSRAEWPLVPYSDVEAACEIPTEDGPHPLAPNGDMAISEECAEALGYTFGVSWSSFDAQPHDIRTPTSSVDSVLGGLLLLISPSGVSIAEAMGPSAPSSMVKRFEEVLIQQPLEETEDVGRLWYEFLIRGIHQIEYSPKLEATAQYGNYTIEVSDIGEAYPAMSFFEASILLAHEGSHYVYGEHAICPWSDKEDCDETPDGAYGSSVWWGYQWMLKNHASLNRDVCLESDKDIYQHNCVQILDSDWKPCEAYLINDLCERPW